MTSEISFYSFMYQVTDTWDVLIDFYLGFMFFSEKQAECAQHRAMFDEIMFSMQRSTHIFIYVLRSIFIY